jgi:hypothetical protein
VSSPAWDNGGITDAGAVTWCNGTTGIAGVINSSNSLVGSSANDQLGLISVTALNNGNYAVGSKYWDNGAVIDAGAITWGNGTTGISGEINSSNSLIGSNSYDFLGSDSLSDNNGITALTNGNYVIRSPFYNDGGIINAGAVTWSREQLALLDLLAITIQL